MDFQSPQRLKFNKLFYLAALGAIQLASTYIILQMIFVYADRFIITKSMGQYRNYRIIIGAMIICQSYILLNSSLQRHHFQTNILFLSKTINIQQLAYSKLQYLRLILVALMYTSGAAIIFDVGIIVSLKYCYIKCAIEAISIISRTHFWRGFLLLAIYISFSIILQKIIDEKKEFRETSLHTIDISQVKPQQKQSKEEEKQDSN